MDTGIGSQNYPGRPNARDFYTPVFDILRSKGDFDRIVHEKLEPGRVKCESERNARLLNQYEFFTRLAGD